MSSAEVETAWSPQNFLQIEVTYDYHVKGFSNHISKYGIGTPVILNRNFPEKESQEKSNTNSSTELDKLIPQPHS